ncbi:MAG: hypothetical protein ACKVYV_17545 [Limisphaerales bacterium]
METKPAQPRIALVLIHGIGEQRPMETLRDFIKAVFPADWTCRSRPDRLAASLEVRKIQVEAPDSGPRVDCHEYYWAHHIQGTSVVHILRWLVRLFRTPDRDLEAMSSHLSNNTYTWAKGAAAATAFLLAAVTAAGMYWVNSGGWASKAWAWIALSPIPLALSGLWLLLQTKFVEVVGDAARYLDNAPANIAARQVIRRECMEILEALNQSYSRVIIVGHSLGSVIAYDALKFLWAGQKPHAGMPATESNTIGLRLLHNPPRVGLPRFLAIQHRLFNELIAGNSDQPWRISDLITLGSPLAHAPMLFSRSRDEFDELKLQREFPTSPPQNDGGSGICGWYEDGTLFLHHAALFAVVRWTNICFPGDPIAGPLRDVFGSGIKDVHLTGGKGNYADHVRYWQSDRPGYAPIAGEIMALVRSEADQAARVQTSATCTRILPCDLDR